MASDRWTQEEQDAQKWTPEQIQAVWGTEPPPTDGGPDLVTVDGVQWRRVGGSQAGGDEKLISDLGGKYDPKYGNLVQPQTWEKYRGQQKGFWDGAGPVMLAGGALAGVTAPAWMAGAATGAEAAAGEVINVADLGLEFDLWDALGEGVTRTVAEEGVSQLATQPWAGTLGEQGLLPGLDYGVSQFGNAAANMMAPAANITGAPLLSEAASTGGGLLDKVIDWAKGNQMLASTGLNLAGGFIKGAMAATPEEKAKAEADEALRILAEKRKFGQVRDVNLPMSPTGTMLRKSSVPGLITGVMR